MREKLLVEIPYGTRNLFLACIDPVHKQFRGIGLLLPRLSREAGTFAGYWGGGSADWSRRRVLSRVLVSGHGREEQPGFTGAPGASLTPGSIRLPSFARIYLTGCYQGSEASRLGWARGCGIPLQQVQGSTGETDSALSTCLLLHLLEEGFASIDHWFPVWNRCNEALRPHFPRIRDLYRQRDADPLRTLAELRELTAVAAFREFIGVIERHPQYLKHLA